MACLQFFRSSQRPRRGCPSFVRPQLETLESRIVPSPIVPNTTYTLPLVNDTGLDPSQATIYVLGYSTGSHLELQSNGQFAPFPGSSGTIPSYDLRTLPSIVVNQDTLPSTGLDDARLYFFVVPNGKPAPTFTYSNNGSSVVQATNPPNSNAPGPFDIVELTVSPPRDTRPPTIDVQTVDGFIFPLTLTLNDNLGQVGTSLSNPAVNRAAILAAYQSFMDAQGAAGLPYRDLLFAPNSIIGQAGGIVNPGRYIADGANPSSPLNTLWDNDLRILFQTPGRTLSLIGDDGAYYKGTPTQLPNGSWVLQFVGYTDAAQTNPNGNVFNIYSPLTPDPLGSYQANESAGEMVFANDGVFADLSQNVLISTNSNVTFQATAVALGLQRDIVAALNRGVALLGPTNGTSGDTSLYWSTETNWYPAGQTSNLFSMFMHTAAINGTPIFVLPNNAVDDAQGSKMGAAYGFAFDESPTHGPSGQPNVPSKFDPVPLGTTTITITLGPWFQPTITQPPSSPPGGGGNSPVGGCGSLPNSKKEESAGLFSLAFQELELTLRSVLAFTLATVGIHNEALDAQIAQLQTSIHGDPLFDTVEGHLAVVFGDFVALDMLDVIIEVPCSGKSSAC